MQSYVFSIKMRAISFTHALWPTLRVSADSTPLY